MRDCSYGFLEMVESYGVLELMPKYPDPFASISLEELSQFTDLPEMLLSLVPTDVKYKTEFEVLREYEKERWGSLLEKMKVIEKPNLLDVERTYNDFDAIFPGYENGKFQLTNEQEMLEKHINLYAEVLEPYLMGASALVELGAGFGSKIFGLAQRAAFAKIPLYAGELTETGRNLISILARSLDRSTIVGHCDFRKLETDIAIPENAIIFTSYAAHYVPELSTDFVGFLSRFKPKVVVHFEPCYEHYTSDSLHLLMCRRYMELNDYTRNLVTVIEEGRRCEPLSIHTRKNVLGSNPFLPISVIEWAPAG